MPDSTQTAPKFYLTTPIYYVNARPHIGHAYTTVVADVLARRHRLLGHPTFFLTGTDEHGQKIERSAIAAGIPPQQFADEVSASFRDLWDRMGITYDKFIRTTDPEHMEGVQHLFRQLQANGAIYKGTYTGQYCVSDEAYVEGPPGIHCPDCGRLTETVSEENYYFKLSAFQLPLLNLIESNTLLIQPDSRRNEVLSFLRGNIPSPIQPGEESPGAPSIPRSGMGANISPQPATPQPGAPSMAQSHRDMGGYGNRPDPTPELPRTAAGTPFLPGALKDLSISRTSFSWGIPVPGDERHVIYVWLDALANYMTALGYPDGPLFKEFWPADLHLVGKEIIRFHCVYWPAFLLALDPTWATLTQSQRQPSAPQTTSSRPEAEGRSGETPVFAPAESPGAPSPPQSDMGENVTPQLTSHLAFDPAFAAKWLPKSVVAHGWLLFEQSKMSKSRGNIVRTETILSAFGDQYLQGIRDHNARELKKDPAFPPVPDPTERDRDLFATDVLRYFLLREIPFGNDGSFSFDAMITRYNADLANGYGNLVSRTLTMIQKYFDGIIPNPPAVEAIVIACSIVPDELLSEYASALNRYQFSRALESVFEIVGKLDTFLTSSAPWKTEHVSDRALTLYVSAEALRVVTLLLHPFMPASIARVWRQLGLSEVDLASPAAKASKIMVCPLYGSEATANSASIPAHFHPLIADRFIDIAPEQVSQMLNFQWGGLTPGTKLGPLAPIFPRADKGLAQIMADTEQTTRPANLQDVATDEHDAATPDRTPFPEAPLATVAAPQTDTAAVAEAQAEVLAHAPAAPQTPTTPSTPATPATPQNGMGENAEPTRESPAAGPRTSTLVEAEPIAQVAASTAPHTQRPQTPSHVAAEPSGLFAGTPSPVSATPADASPQITIDDFVKVELRVAQILVAERIPKADKLLRLEVDLGHERRQILSGIAEWYTPEDLLGRRIIVVTNLAPRTMRGLQSHGMLLAASTPEDPKPILATVPEPTPLGTRLK